MFNKMTKKDLPRFSQILPLEIGNSVTLSELVSFLIKKSNEMIAVNNEIADFIFNGNIPEMLTELIKEMTEEVNEKLNTINSSLLGITSDVAENKTDILNIEGDIVAVISSIDDLGTIVNGFSSTIQNLQNDLLGVTNKTDENYTEIVSLKNVQSENESEFERINLRIDNLGEGQDFGTDIALLKNRLDVAEGKLNIIEPMINQDVKTTASPTFEELTVEVIHGAKYEE